MHSRWSSFRVVVRMVVILLMVQVVDCYMGETRRRCQDITIPLCKGVGYNRTYMPNQFNHLTQEEAGMEVHQFWPLVEINCSPDLRFFLCSMYTPICIESYTKPLPVCRSVCERAKAGCLGLMHSYGFEWPKHLDCEKLPVFGNPNELCMDANQTEKNAQNGDQHQQPQGPASTVPRKNGFGPGPAGGIVEKAKLPGFRPSGGDKSSFRKSNIQESPGVRKCMCTAKQCDENKRFRLLTETEVRGGVANITGCTYSCRNALSVSNENHDLIHFWIGLWSVLCCASTLFTVLTFAIDMTRFRYPERPIIFLSFCYFMVSIGYIIRVAAGHDSVACNGDYIRTQTNGPALCTVVFVLIYFFGMASSVWWVNLSLTWFLAAGLKWSNEAIAGYSQYFHIAAWAVPSIKTVAVLVLAGVDGDPVSGICYVGNTNITMLRIFVLAPLFAYLVLGSFFLLSGFVSLVRIRNIVKQQHGGVSKMEKLEKLMVRIGIFSVLYTIPATFMVGCYFYEQHYRLSWDWTSLCDNMDVCVAEGRFTPSYLAFPMFMVKYFMCLIVGITSGIWIWSRKTLESWRRFFVNSSCWCCCPSRSSSSNLSTMYNGQGQKLLVGGGGGGGGGGVHQPMIGAIPQSTPRDFYDYNGGSGSAGLFRSSKGPPSAAGYMPTEAIIIKSHTDISSGCYSRQYPVNHV